VSAPNTPSTFTARIASASSTGLPETNLVWKEQTIRCQQRPRWMAHATSPEHIEGGLMFGFDVLQREPEVIL
jgi:hypothetical protein